MPDKQRVCKGLYAHGYKDCTSCPYWGSGPYGGSECTKLAREALSLLREHEPIVRCKDCQHSCDYTDIFPDRAYRCTKNGGYHDGSWFCADGKKAVSEIE